MTADGAAERLSRIAPNSLTEHRKPEQGETLRREKMRLSATKITSIVECAAQRAKFHQCLLGTPQAPKSAEQTRRNRLTPIE